MATVNNSNNIRSKVFSLAWQFIRKNGYNLSKALKTAWANIKLSKAMRTQIVQFYYIKKSTSELRQAFGTMQSNIIEGKVNGDGTNSTTRANNDLILYYDTICEGFRCFKSYNLVNVIL